ncbi:MAG: Hpt domain-containing protein [Terrimicrobiaceae bacterium]
MRRLQNTGKIALTSGGNRLFLSGTMATESERIDWDQLDMMADGYTRDFVEIYREFIGQTPELLDALEKHLRDDNLAAARDAAHKIKGSSANFGFVGVSGPMSRLEMKAKEEGSLEGAPEAMLEARENFEGAKAEIREKRGI